MKNFFEKEILFGLTAAEVISMLGVSFSAAALYGLGHMNGKRTTIKSIQEFLEEYPIGTDPEEAVET